ncbi:MAG: DNA polymerase II [Gammaproteobacteria bacterium]|nr:MAG: DNA polymerase II [Gammaproteobacteria bacterium]
MTDSTEIRGYLLSRHWRDTPQGLELNYWLASARGPVRLSFTEQQAVCFIDRDVPMRLPAGVERRELALTNLRGQAVDGLYFRSQATLNELRRICDFLHESDIRPTDRYLMERFVRAGVSIEGTPREHDGILRFDNPQIRATEVAPGFHTVALDIETRAWSQQLYSIASASMQQPDAAVVFMLGEDRDTARDGYTLHYRKTERELLLAWFDWLSHVDPDILVGWAVVNFDLDFLDRKCRELGLPFLIGRGGETAAVLQPGSSGAPRVARVPGRAVLDGIDLLKAGFWSFESFSLDNVAHELLGAGKLIGSEADKVSEINRLFRDDKPALADYNFLDCQLVNRIFERAALIPFAIERANLTGLALDRLGGSVAAFDNLYLPRLHRRGFIADDIGQSEGGLGSPGGFVMDSEPGLYRNILVLDFKSLYPSIIRTFLIDPLGLALAKMASGGDNVPPDDDTVPGFIGARFSRQDPILPALIAELWTARDHARAERNAALSQAIKIIMNSFYGVLGSSGCRFHSAQLASSITRRGHEVINRTREWIEAMGHQVIYGDTDSVFVLPGNGDAMTRLACHELGDRLAEELNQRWQQVIADEYSLECHLEIEFETLYSRFLMPTVRGAATGSKKRYAGLVYPHPAAITADRTADRTADNDNDAVAKVEANAEAEPDAERPDKDEPRLVVKGLEAARTDWTPLAREFQRELFRRVFLDEPVEDFVRDIRERLHAGELDDMLVYRKRLRRKLGDYQRNVPPHVQAARKLGRRSGNTIRYFITVNGPEPAEARASLIDYQHYEDRQLAPAADSILMFLDTSFASLTDRQLSMF